MIAGVVELLHKVDDLPERSSYPLRRERFNDMLFLPNTKTTVPAATLLFSTAAASV